MKQQTFAMAADPYTDKIGDAIRELVRRKVVSGATETVTPLESTSDAVART